MIIESGLFLVSWVFRTENIPLCLCESVEDAKAVVMEKVDFLTWDNPPKAVTIWWSPLNIVHEGSTLQGVMIQQVPIYKVGNEQSKA